MKSDIEVKIMSNNDIDEVVKIEQEAFSLPWSRNAFEESLSQSYALFFVAWFKEPRKAEKNIAGYVGVYHIGDECDITNIAVSSAYRRKGIARELLKAVEEYANSHNVQSVNLEVRESNTPAIKLYEAMEYKNIGIRKNFYEKPTENAIIMIRQF